MPIDWRLVYIFILFFISVWAISCAVLTVWWAFKSFRVDQWMFKRRCKHSYRIVEYCENCGDVINVRFLEGEEE